MQFNYLNKLLYSIHLTLCRRNENFVNTFINLTYYFQLLFSNIIFISKVDEGDMLYFA